MQSRVHGGNKAEISPMTAASHIPDRTNLYMDGVDANPVYETRTPATDLAPLAKGVLGSRPMHILPPVSSSSWWRRRLTTMRLSNDHPTRERRAEAIGGEGRECPPPPLRKWQTLGGGGGGGEDVVREWPMEIRNPVVSTSLRNDEGRDDDDGDDNPPDYPVPCTAARLLGSGSRTGGTRTKDDATMPVPPPSS